MGALTPSVRGLLLAVGAVCWLCPAQAYFPPADAEDGLFLRIEGFDEQVGVRAGYRQVDGTAPFEYAVTVSNGSSRVARSRLSSELNDDWSVEPQGYDIDLPPDSIVQRTFRAVPIAADRIEPAVYPIHVCFGCLHAIAVFKADVIRTPWNKVEPLRECWSPRKGPLGEIASREEKTWIAAEKSAERNPAMRFAFADGVQAFVALGEQGVTDGVIVLSDGRRRLAWRGFVVCVSGRQVGATADGASRFSRVDVKRRDDGSFGVCHVLPTGGGELVLRASFRAQDGGLKIAWDMPDVRRTEDGTPRYTALHLGSASEAPVRFAAGMGEVIDVPKRLLLAATAHQLTTRHVGAEYPCGLSVVLATDVAPDACILRSETRTCHLVAHNDATFTIVPSRHGMFDAARRFAVQSGYRRSPGYAPCATRVCLDDWYAQFDELTESVRRFADYGVTNVVFIKHDWSRWGFDRRLPDFHPAGRLRGGPGALKTLSETARGLGMRFGVHENYIDFYPDATGFSYDNIVHKAKTGEPARAWFNEGYNGQSYLVCPDRMYPFAERNAKLAREAFAPNAHFIDVFGIKQPFDYHDRFGKFHAQQECASHWGGIFDRYRQWLGVQDGVMVSEGGTDFLIGHLDAGQCDHLAPEVWGQRGKDYSDGERMPWHDLVTHGKFVLMAGGLPRRYGAAYGSDDYLETTVIGGRMPMAAGLFSRESVMTDWLLRNWWTCVANEEIVSFELSEDDIRRRRTTFGNGASVCSNRGTNGIWCVDGVELPRFGFHAKGPGYEGGVIRKDGHRVAFAKTKDAFFVDARPRYEKPVQESVASWVEGGEVISRNRLKLRVGWKVLKPGLKVLRGFVQAQDVTNDREGPILFGGRMDVRPDDLTRPGEVSLSDLTVIVPDEVAAGEYQVKYGLTANGRRVQIDAVRDGHNRVLAGVISVVKDGARITSVSWSRPQTKEEAAQEAAQKAELNLDGRIINFGGIRTDGAFRLERSGADWSLQPLPGSLPFAAEIDFRKVGGDSRRIRDVEVVGGGADAKVVEWKQRNGLLRLRCDGKAMSYRVTMGD